MPYCVCYVTIYCLRNCVIKVFDDKTVKVCTRVNGWLISCGCIFENVLSIWCSSLRDQFDMRLAFMYKSSKIVSFMFLHFLSA